MRGFAVSGFVVCLVGVGTGTAQPPTPPPALTADVLKLTPRASLKLPHEVVTTDMPTPLLLSADGGRLAVGVYNPKAPAGSRDAVQVWALKPQPKLVAEFAGGAGLYSFSPSGKRLLTSEKRELYDVDTKRPLMKLYDFTHVYLRDDATAVATSRGYDFANHRATAIQVWDAKKGAKPAATIPVPDNRFERAIPAKGGREMWLYRARGDKGEVEFYDLDTRALRHTIKLERPDASMRLGLYPSASPDGAYFASNAGRWVIHDATTGKIVTAAPPDLHGNSAGFLPTGTRFFATPVVRNDSKHGYGVRDVIVYDWKAQKAVAALTGLPPRQSGESISDPPPGASADGKTVVIAARSGEVLVFDLPDVK